MGKFCTLPFCYSTNSYRHGQVGLLGRTPVASRLASDACNFSSTLDYQGMQQ